MFLDEFSDGIVAFENPRTFVEKPRRFQERFERDNDLGAARPFESANCFFECFTVTLVAEKLQRIGHAEGPFFGESRTQFRIGVPWSFPGIRVFGIFSLCDVQDSFRIFNI